MGECKKKQRGGKRALRQILKRMGTDKLEIEFSRHFLFGVGWRLLDSKNKELLVGGSRSKVFWFAAAIARGKVRARWVVPDAQ